MKDWWARWGPWVGPTSLLAILALVGRMEACTNARAADVRMVEANKAAIETIVKRQDSTDRWIEEHKQVATSRIAQLEAQDKLIALLKAQGERTDRDITEMKQDIREIRNRLRYQTGSGGQP